LLENYFKLISTFLDVFLTGFSTENDLINRLTIYVMSLLDNFDMLRAIELQFGEWAH